MREMADMVCTLLRRNRERSAEKRWVRTMKMETHLRCGTRRRVGTADTLAVGRLTSRRLFAHPAHLHFLSAGVKIGAHVEGILRLV